MTESKIDLTNRLKREGRWEEASLLKDQKIKKFRDSGMKRPDAQDKAWEAMEVEFPPAEALEIPRENEPGSELTVEQIAGLSAGTLKEFSGDVAWTYANLETTEDFTEEPPSTGALALLKWARANQQDFFSKIVPKAIQIQEKQSGQDAEEDEIDREEVERIKKLFKMVRSQ